MTMQEIEDSIAEEEERANTKLEEFIHKVEVVATRCVVKLGEVSTAMAIKIARKARKQTS